MSRATQYAIIMDYYRAVLFVRCTVCVCNMLYINFVIILFRLMHFLVSRHYVCNNKISHFFCMILSLNA